MVGTDQRKTWTSIETLLNTNSERNKVNFDKDLMIVFISSSGNFDRNFLILDMYVNVIAYFKWKIKGNVVLDVNYATFSCGKSEMYYQFIITSKGPKKNLSKKKKNMVEEKKKTEVAISKDNKLNGSNF